MDTYTLYYCYILLMRPPLHMRRPRKTWPVPASASLSPPAPKGIRGELRSPAIHCTAATGLRLVISLPPNQEFDLRPVASVASVVADGLDFKMILVIPERRPVQLLFIIVVDERSKFVLFRYQ